jgi:hypothetical protein
MMEKGKESEFPEGRVMEIRRISEGFLKGKGSGIREADSDDRGFPLNLILYII